MTQALVIGSTPEALAHAAGLASHGVAVRYLGTAESPEGIDPTTPLGCGAVRIESGADVARLSRAWGPVQAVRHGHRRIRWRGELRGLPRTRWERAAWVGEVGGIGGLLEAWRRRTGGATYADRVRARYGSRFAESVVLPWVGKRFAASPETLDPSLFDVLHAPRGGAWMAPRDGWVESVQHQRATILEADGEVLDGVTVEALEVEDGRVIAVLTDVGREVVFDGVWVDAPAAHVARWLGRPDPGLRLAELVQVTVPCAPGALPWQVLDASADRPFWRLTRPDLLPGPVREPCLTAHLTVSDGASDASLVDRVRVALGDITPLGDGPAWVQRVPDAVPVPEVGAPARHAAWTAELRTLGIRPVGRRAGWWSGTV